MPDPLELDVFWSFRSPWSYLATGRLADWERRYQLAIRFRPVYPIAIRTPDFFQQINPLWPAYLMVDVHRVAEFLEIPFRWPRPDPVAQELREGGLFTSEVQPYIHRLTRLGVVAEQRGRGIAFADEVSRLIWGGTENWHEGAQLAEASGRAGLELAELDKVVETETDRLEAAIQQNQADHQAVGHWGVPTCAFRGEPFFGQDRLDVLLWRLRQNGLKER